MQKKFPSRLRFYFLQSNIARRQKKSFPNKSTHEELYKLLALSNEENIQIITSEIVYGTFVSAENLVWQLRRREREF